MERPSCCRDVCSGQEVWEISRVRSQATAFAVHSRFVLVPAAISEPPPPLVVSQSEGEAHVGPCAELPCSAMSSAPRVR